LPSLDIHEGGVGEMMRIYKLAVANGTIAGYLCCRCVKCWGKELHIIFSFYEKKKLPDISCVESVITMTLLFFFGKMVTFVREVGRVMWGESAEKRYEIYEKKRNMRKI